MVDLCTPIVAGRDWVFVDRWPAVFGVALAIFEVNEQAMLCLGAEPIAALLRRPAPEGGCGVLALAHGTVVKVAHLKAWEAEYSP